jgi:hypothetical protein
MKPHGLFHGVLALGASISLATAQVGDKMPQVSFDAFGNTKATSIEDFQGRLVLLEVFAYW